MRDEVLLLLDGNEDACKLVATWPTVGPRFAEDPQAMTEEDRVAYDQRVNEEWERISGVHIDDIERLVPVLFENEMLGPGGFVDEKAEGFVRAQIAFTLRKLKGNAKREPSPPVEGSS